MENTLLEKIMRSTDLKATLKEITIHKRKRRTKPKNRVRSRAAKKALRSASTKRNRRKALMKFYKSSAGKQLAKARGRYVKRTR